MRIRETPNGFRFMEMLQHKLPLCEDKCPPVFDENGNEYYPEPVEYVDPEIREEDEYAVEDKEEFYDYVTVCSSCGTKFIAREAGDIVRNYCPGCGKRLVSE